MHIEFSDAAAGLFEELALGIRGWLDADKDQKPKLKAAK